MEKPIVSRIFSPLVYESGFVHGLHHQNGPVTFATVRSQINRVYCLLVSHGRGW